ncbi:unnamed protein product [Penicillium salamii]|uniref:Uncharacterized protein n=2 Tax=Penicillium TaxID=5073 RepID=A0A9W4K648_9EURO|nr:unnamed protein product [Penicillium salamii]CRL30662.1 unnamed protein product [Penicillium camemberti]CAG8287839.1 unnamed protein product [Penicillium salamii]CAG8307049.1 unnamed protein product [Penicillium salamii]CAG8308402.1 unnamed protein product [Penicillium salamii]
MFELSIVACLLSVIGASTQSVIYSGQGFATEYYDVKDPHVCGWSYDSMNQGNVACNPTIGLSLEKIDSNHLVAMNNTLLHTDLSLYCGKKVVVSVNGKPSSLPLFIGDGCGRCSSGPSTSRTWNPSAAPGIDLSHEVLQELSRDACHAGHVEISWEVFDEQVYEFDALTSSTAEVTIALPSPASEAQTWMATGSFASYTRGPCMTCVDNAWKCDGNVLEQCIGNTWTPRVTCAVGTSCQGGSNPYCA